jgi:integrase
MTTDTITSSTHWPGERANAPGPGTERSAFDASFTLLGEPFEMSARAPIPGHPGFYRERGRVYFRIRDPRGRRRWLTASTIKEAERKKLAAELDVERGDYHERSRETFASYAPSWIETYTGRTSRGVSETTKKDYRRRLEQDAIPFFGRMRLSEIEPQDVKAYALALAEQGKAPDTVRLAVAPVRALLATALEEGLIRSNPAAGLRLAQRRPETVDGDDHLEQVKAMSEQELTKLLAQIAQDAPEWTLFFRVLAWSGMRIGELVELRWKDVDLGERIVHVRRRFYDGRVGLPKSKYGRRRLRLPPDLARALWTYRGATGDMELVFVSLDGRRQGAPPTRGDRISPSNLMRRVLKPAAVEAGLGEWVPDRNDSRKLRAESWVGFHSFRHTCATILFRRGWNAVQVQRWLGHHKPSFTLDTYVHLLGEDVPEPAFFDQLAGALPAARTDQTLTKSARNAPLGVEPRVSAKPGISTVNANQPEPARDAAGNS